MAGGDDDYGEAFKKAKLEHDQQLEAPTEAKRLQAEADADIAVLSNVVLPQLQAAAQKLHPLGGKVEIQMALPRDSNPCFRRERAAYGFMGVHKPRFDPQKRLETFNICVCSSMAVHPWILDRY